MHHATPVFFLTALTLSIPACSDTLDEPDRFEQLFSGGLTVLDLTHSLTTTGPHWPSPDGNPFKHEILRAQPSGAAAMASYSTPEHHGTHLDAPIHSADLQPTVDQLTHMDLFGPAAVIDVASKCESDPDYQLTKEDILAWEQRHGMPRRNSEPMVDFL